MKSFKISVICLSIYFIYHLVNGPRGFVSWLNVRGEIQKNEKELHQLQKEKDEIELVVNLLRPGNIDPDLLSERARSILGYAHKDDDVIFLFKN